MSAPRFELMYWGLRFRGAYARTILSYANVPYDEPDFKAIIAEKKKPYADMMVPFMGPPRLYDRQTGFGVSQTLAICTYLVKVLGYEPEDPGKAALAVKVAADCLDINIDFSNNNGHNLWEHSKWDSWWKRGGRFDKYLQIIEATCVKARRNSTGGDDDGNKTYLLGTDKPTMADFATFAILAQIIDCFSDAVDGLTNRLEEVAPTVMKGIQRLESESPSLAKLRATDQVRFKQNFCGGHIEKSIRMMMSIDKDAAH